MTQSHSLELEQPDRFRGAAVIVTEVLLQFQEESALLIDSEEVVVTLPLMSEKVLHFGCATLHFMGRMERGYEMGGLWCIAFYSLSHR